MVPDRICLHISSTMQVVAIDKPPPKTANTTKIFPDMLGVGGNAWSPLKIMPVLLIKLGHHSSKPLVRIHENLPSIEDGTYESR